MMSTRPGWTVSAVVLLSLLGPMRGQAESPAEVTITNLEGKSAAVAMKDLADSPRAALRARDRDGREHHFEGGEIHELLKRVSVSTGDDLRGARMREFVVIEGADGYRVAYSIGELSPRLTDRKVLLADRIDGMPLSSEAGPFRVIVEGDRRHSRWVRNVTSIRVLDSDRIARPADNR